MYVNVDNLNKSLKYKILNYKEKIIAKIKKKINISVYNFSLYMIIFKFNFLL